MGVCCVALFYLATALAAGSHVDRVLPGGTIAVATTADFRTIYLISPAARETARVRAPEKVVGLQVDLSRDGKRIAFGGMTGIWTLSRWRPRVARRVLSTPLSTFGVDWVVWSPDGRELAYTRGESLFRVRATGGRPLKLLSGRAYAPDWSPTGSRILFVRNPSLVTGAGLIQSIGIDGMHLRSIVRGGHPDVSPDGSEIAFSRRDGIYVMPLTGGTPTRVVLRGEHPEWSPDGRYLAFTREVQCGHAGCEGRVFIVKSTGGEARPIGPRILDIGPLSWSR